MTTTESKIFDVSDGESSQAVLTTQSDQSSAVRQFSTDLDALTAQLRTSDPDIRRVIGNGIPASEQVGSLVRDGGSSQTTDLSNLASTARTFEPCTMALQPLLIFMPGLAACSPSAIGDGPAKRQGLVLETNVPFPCTVGYEGALAILNEMKRQDPRFDDTQQDFPVNTADNCLAPQGRGNRGPISLTARWISGAGWAAPFLAMPYAAMLVSCGFATRAVLSLSVQCGGLASSSLSIPTAAMAGFYQDLAAGEILTAPIVISDVDIIKTYTELVGVEHLPFPQRQQVQRWKMSRPLINGFFGVEFDANTQPNSNYFAIPNWDSATSLLSLARFSGRVIDGKGFSDGQSWARAMAAGQPMFLQSSSRRDPEHRAAAPRGYSTIEVQTITPPDPKLWGYTADDADSGEYRKSRTYNEIKKIVLDGMLERMEQAYPGSSTRVHVAELGSPATQTRFVGNTDGAPFGPCTPSRSIRSVAPAKPHRDRRIARGRYQHHMGAGTVGSMLSGVHAASAVTGRDLVHEIRTGQVVADATRLSHWDKEFDALGATRGFSDQSSHEEHPCRRGALLILALTAAGAVV
ncbi:hypothetical protein ACFWNH_30350 [Rhodococcus qingshengii]|uniref:hypothetical protein n=1 Tax=Rhodococcus qingshengii TaxID=334542 RepID=UPI0036614EAE